jgi:hypothetical protein
MTDAHDQSLTIHLQEHIPEHEPRESDPHYALFNQARARMKRQGLLVCAIGDDYCEGGVELHHSHIEFSLVGTVDPDKLAKALGLHFTSDDDFQSFIEGPGNLEPLCAIHHRTKYGIHMIPGPLWEPLRYRKAGMVPNVEFVPASKLSKGTA